MGGLSCNCLQRPQLEDKIDIVSENTTEDFMSKVKIEELGEGSMVKAKFEEDPNEKKIREEEERLQKEEEERLKKEEEERLKREEEERLKREEEERLKREEEERLIREEEERKKNEPHKFTFQSSVNNKELEKELQLAEEKKLIMEKITFFIELQELVPKLHQDKEFVGEIQFSLSEGDDAFFTIGNTKNYKPDDKMCITFEESYEVGYLFERTQKIKVIVYCSDGKTCEVTMNLAKMIFRKLDPCPIPINMVDGSVLEYNMAQKRPENYDQTLLFTFKRTTLFLDIKLTSLYVDWTYPLATMAAKNLRYSLIAEDKSKKQHKLYTSNEVCGKNPLQFAIATFENRDLFTNVDISHYYLLFEEDEKYFGKTKILRKEMDEMLESEAPADWKCKYGKSEEEEKKEKEEKEGSESKDKNKLGLKSPDKKIRGSNKKLSASPSPKKKTNDKKSSEKEDRLTYEVKLKVCVKEIQRKKFLDYILEGMNVSFDVAVDYTSSNLDPKDPESLHTLNLENNKYCKAINSCGGILQNYDRYQVFKTYGFGGVPTNGKEVSHCFNLNGKKDAGIKGLENVIETYKDNLKTIELVGPTYLHMIIKNIIEVINKAKVKEKEPIYHVFLILTDGALEDMDETLDILIDACKLPLSLIIVGIGNGDFTKMNILGKFNLN